MKNIKKSRFYFVPVYVFALCVFFSGSFVRAEESAANRFSEAVKTFEAYVQERMVFDKAVGISAAFMKDDFTWAKGFGYADLENKSPAKPGSSYRLASVSKTMTAIAVLQLVEKGEIDLDAAVQTYVPYFPKKKWPLTVRLLLGHLGGISHYKDYDKEGHIKVHKNTEEALKIFSDFDLVAEPGTKFNYSSYGYNLLAAVVEGASGQSFGDYLQEHIFAPLHMENSRLDDPVEIIPYRVRGYRLLKGKIKNSEYVDISSRLGGGCVRSTVLDLLKYARGVFSFKLLTKETTRLMFRSMATRAGFFTGYGMGWRVDPYAGHFQVAHSGGQPETATRLIILPRLNFAAAFASNREGFTFTTYINRLVELVLQEDVDIRPFALNAKTRDMLNACHRVYSYGLAYFERHSAPQSQKQQELEKAFAFFNENVNIKALKKNYPKIKKKINSGIHPVAKQAFTKIGSFMATALHDAYGKEKLKDYYRLGFFSFFNDYIKLSRSWPKEKKTFIFSKRFAKTVKGWQRDWQRTYTPYARSLNITGAADFSEIENRLKKVFSKARVYPDFRGDMFNTAYGFLFDDKVDKAIDIFYRYGELYRDRTSLCSHLAFAYLWKGDTDRSRRLFKEAFKKEGGHPGVSPRRFDWYSRQLKNRDKLKELFVLLEIALELHPENPAVLKTAADFYAGAGREKDARRCYREALRLKPDYAEAKKALKKIEKNGHL
ncbi:MAG: serine hydrolase [Candidatus Aminicenantes bacterium]|nr:serine hydrolase [Candidatus Aminicenantes bacterium]